MGIPTCLVIPKIPRVILVNEQFFSRCERDEKGWCIAEGGPERNSPPPAVNNKEAITKLEKFKEAFEDQGLSILESGWVDRLIDQVKSFGSEKVLKDLGGEIKNPPTEKVLYHGGEFNEHIELVKNYLEQNGIILATASIPTNESLRVVSSESEAIPQPKRTVTDFVPKEPNAKNKLEEAKLLPGLETSEDIHKVVGKEVTSVSTEVVKKLDEKYGKDKWILKPYGDEAFQGFGIYFPQKIQQIKDDAKRSIPLLTYTIRDEGYNIIKNQQGTIIGIKDPASKKELFMEQIGTPSRYFPDSIQYALANVHHYQTLMEQGPTLPSKQYMAQPAFNIMGLGEAERRQGVVTGKDEGRVHILTDKNGNVSVVPYATVLKDEMIPVITHTEETKKLEEAALQAIKNLPLNERSGQIYAPDVVKTDKGYKVVEANPANSVGSSGYLAWAPEVIDAYVSYLMGREPLHVKTVRDLLTQKEQKVTTNQIPQCVVVNANPKGCNQWTGPDCDGSIGETNEERTTLNPSGSIKGRNQSKPPIVGGPVEGKTGRPRFKIVDTTEKGRSQSVATRIASPISKKGISITPKQVSSVVDNIEKIKSKYTEDHDKDIVNWYDRLKSQIELVGVKSALKQLGPKPLNHQKLEPVYFSHSDFTNRGDKDVAQYFAENGIFLKKEKGMREISGYSKDVLQGKFGPKDFIPSKAVYKNKLEESQAIPGLENTQDVSKLVGYRVKNLTPEVTQKFDKEFGKGKWIVKNYGDDAFQSHGIYFPQFIDTIRNTAKVHIKDAQQKLDKLGFKPYRDKEGTIVGIENKTTGKQIKFNSSTFQEIGGPLKDHAGTLEFYSKEEKGPYLEKDTYMVQPAYKVVGMSDQKRAKGEIINYGQEGRVHIVTKGGNVGQVPYSTIVKGEQLPVVIESKETKAMAKAALDAINSLPEKARKGQIYAPDVIKTDKGYKVVELNPADSVGSSGYLVWNDQVIDAYVSHLMGREPTHAKFVRSLLENEEGLKESLQTKGKYWGSKLQPYQYKEANPTSDIAAFRGSKKDPEILLIQRSKTKADGSPNVEGGKWALPGGFQNTIAAPGETFIKSGETPRKAALRELQEETKLDLKKFAGQLKQVGIYEKNGRDPRDNAEAWSRSHAFVIHLPKGFKGTKIAGSDDAGKAKWVKVKDLHKYKLAFDHSKIINDSLKKANLHHLVNNHIPPVVIVQNVFCPTGEGGGVDPSCDKGGSIEQHSRTPKELIKKYDQEVFQKLNEQELKTLHDYTHMESSDLNKALREGGLSHESNIIKKWWNLSAEHRTMVKDIEKMIEMSPTLKPTMVYRGVKVKSDEIQDQLINLFREALKKGEPVKLPGFTSTSFSKEVGKTFSRYGEKQFLLSIIAKKGLALEGVSTMDGEHEFLMSTTAKFKVLKVKRTGIHTTEVELEQL